MKKMKNRPLSAIVLSAFILSSCTTAPSKISATYVSPLVYQDSSCRQIRAEISRVTRKTQEITGVQEKEATKDAWAMGVGLVVFWPALFFLMGDDKKVELGNLKGEYDALEQTAIKKNCEYVKDLRENKKKYMEEELKKKLKKQAEQKKNHTGFNN